MFGTDDNIAVFEELVKKLGGSPNFKVASEYQGKQTHRTVAIGLRYFELATRKNIIKSKYFKYEVFPAGQYARWN